MTLAETLWVLRDHLSKTEREDSSSVAVVGIAAAAGVDESGEEGTGRSHPEVVGGSMAKVAAAAVEEEEGRMCSGKETRSAMTCEWTGKS